jgi:hypothetical protein
MSIAACKPLTATAVTDVRSARHEMHITSMSGMKERCNGAVMS